MIANEFLSFITPQPEPLQLSFFILILLMFFGTIISTYMNAKDVSWEKNWGSGAPNDHGNNLDIDHGSVTDLWNAVATKSEKLAEIMPGLLLVVGLLGTFLGLGLALNNASNILSQTNALTPTGAASNMQDLMNMMQGLGTKFKTSTWGITFFLLLKVWSSWKGFEERRLAWVIRKVKTELERRKTQEQENDFNKRQTLFSQINQAAGQIVQGLTQNFGKLFDSQKNIQQENFKFFRSGIKAIHDDLVNINGSIQGDSAAIKQVLEQSVQSVRADLGSINTATQASGRAMVDFVTSTHTIIKDMSAASHTMADGAHKVGEAGNSLVKAVDDFSTQFTQVLGEVRTDLSSAINDMSEQAAQTLEQGTRELGKATLEISTALGVLSKDVTTTMNGVKDSIEKSLKIQQDGAILFRRSSDTLNENVSATTELVEKLGNDITSSLQAVSDSGRRMASIGKSLETIVPEIENLAPALKPLEILNTTQQSLLSETKGLRIDFLKPNSKRELQFESLLKIQQDGVAQFRQSTDTSNENFATMKILIEKLGVDIHSSLQAVSVSDRRVEAVLREIHDFRKNVAVLPKIVLPTKSGIDAQS